MSMENRSQSNQTTGHLNLYSESLCRKYLHNYKRSFYNYRSTTSILFTRKVRKCTEIIYEDFERDIDSEKFIHLMSKQSYVKGEKTEEIRNELASNSTMQLLIQQIKSGWPSE